MAPKRWQNGDYSLDDWDAEKERADDLSDYVGAGTESESVTEAYCADGGRIDVSAEEGDGNGEHWKNTQAIDTSTDHTPAATILTGTEPNSNMWRLHEDMKITVYDEEADEYYTTPHSDGDKRAENLLFEAKVQSLDLGRDAREAVFTLVKTDENMNVWNRWHSGNDGAIVGYAAWYLNQNSPESARSYARAVASELGLDEDDAVDATEYAFQRADDRGLTQ
ncbi:hypothetical protein ACM16X_08865 [Haloarcula japonica]|uniref:hypothetical protein n=1 Tax=Haloarcula japonica TaxID=29282 RepID=UPI0039F6E3BE